MIFRHIALEEIWVRWNYIEAMILVVLITTIFGSSCSPEPDRLVLATTTSTYDSGLLDEILPEFENRYDAQVDVIAVGTGQAIAIGERGDADVLLVHDREKELAFVQAGFGSERVAVMFNDFVIVGPLDDPANLNGVQDAVSAFIKLAENEVPFVSRGDQSGTHARELIIWRMAGFDPSSSMNWYFSIGQGMGETLQFAQEIYAYTITDRGTYLSLSENLQELMIVVGGASIEHNPDPSLINEYSVIPVIQEESSDTPSELALAFVEWLASTDTKGKIAAYKKFGQPLFRPTQP
jgi:tungstate transport system substrate-binding protein